MGIGVYPNASTCYSTRTLKKKVASGTSIRQLSAEGGEIKQKEVEENVSDF